MIDMEPLFDLTLDLGGLIAVGQLAIGERRVAAIRGGKLAGPALNGTIVSGSDTQLLRADGVLEIDASYVATLAQGEHLRIVNQGYRHGPAEVLARLARGEAVAPAEYFFRSVMRFECAAPHLSWLNRTIAVAHAARLGDQVMFHAFAVR